MSWTHPSQGFLAPAGVGRVWWRFPEHHWSDAGRRPLVPRCTRMAPVGSFPTPPPPRPHHRPDTRPPPALRGGQARGSQPPSSFQRLPSSQAPGASPPPCQCVTATPPTLPPSFSSPAMPSGAPSAPGALLLCAPRGPGPPSRLYPKAQVSAWNRCVAPMWPPGCGPQAASPPAGLRQEELLAPCSPPAL